MTKYIIGEILSSGGATLYKNPSDQTVLALNPFLFSASKTRNPGFGYTRSITTIPTTYLKNPRPDRIFDLPALYFIFFALDIKKIAYITYNSSS